MERIYNEYKDGHIDLLDVYYLCIGRLKLSKEDALISTCSGGGLTARSEESYPTTS